MVTDHGNYLQTVAVRPKRYDGMMPNRAPVSSAILRRLIWIEIYALIAFRKLCYAVLAASLASVVVMLHVFCLVAFRFR